MVDINGRVTVTSTTEPFAQSIVVGKHTFVADEPIAAGGSDLGPNPYDMLLASLGACTAMTLRLYARRKQWPLDRVVVELTHQRVHAEDCEHCDDPARFLEEIKRRITLVGALTDDQRKRLGDVAVHCPIHKTMAGKLRILTEIVEEGKP